MTDNNEQLNFAGLVAAIRQVHEHCASQAGKAINVSLTLRNWVIGYYILEYEQRGGDRADYGERLLRNKCTLHMLMWFSATTDGEQLPEECSLITQRCLPIDDEPQLGGSRYALVQVPQSVQSATGPIPRKISLKINAIDRRISVAPMMEWFEI